MSWRDITLGALCAEGGGGVQTGPFGSQLHAADYVLDGVPSVMPQNIGDNVIDEQGIARITPDDASRLEKYLLVEGDIVYSRRGDVEKRALVRAHNEGWLCGTGCLRVRVGDSSRADARFVSYLLGAPEIRGWISRHAVGATMPNLNTKILSSVPLRVPSVTKQRAIAEVLETLDDKIAANVKLVGTSTQFAMTLLAEAIEFDSVRRPISEVTTLLARGITPSYTVSEESSMVVLNQKCVRDQRVLQSPSRRTGLDKVRPEKVLKVGDVLVNSTGQGTLGRVARWTGIGEVTVDSHVTIVRFDPDRVDLTSAGFAMLALQSEIEALGEGSTGQTELSRVELGRLDLVLPSAEVSRRSGVQLAAMSAMEDSLVRENELLAALRDTLLPELMSGRLHVKDAEKKIEEVV